MSLDQKDIDRLSLYADGALSGEERRRVDALLARDAEARRVLKELKALGRDLKGLPLLQPPEAFYNRVMRDIEAPAPRRSFFAYFPLKTVGALAATALVVVATSDFWRPQMAGRKAAAPSPLQFFQEPLKAQQARALETQEVAPARELRSRLSQAEEGKNVLERDQASLDDLRAKDKSASVTEELLRSKKEVPESAVSLSKSLPMAAPPPAAPPAPSVDRTDKPLLQKSSRVAKADRTDEPLVRNSARAAQAKMRKEDGGSRARASGKAVADADMSLNERAPAALGSAVGGYVVTDEATGQMSATPAAMEWIGQDSAVQAPRQASARTPAEWAALWNAHAPASPVPRVDFSQWTAVAVFAGEKSTAGYGVRITGVQPAPGAATITYKETLPPADAFLAQVMTSPYHIRLIPRADKIRFKKQP